MGERVRFIVDAPKQGGSLKSLTGGMSRPLLNLVG